MIFFQGIKIMVLIRHNAYLNGYRVNTNRWDPILNYPGCMGVALRLRLYLN